MALKLAIASAVAGVATAQLNLLVV